ncbi:hypothetical protein [Muriicola soli]|uniref:Uncharacterized protein n=1 Tax=Muriicola soli TaxID=2507538 RepID=A0A411EBP8_9FLAO|nr:hypothetical protein [Muriicola soli]QBA64937.1 hypothetical protein EQY75_10605 [Muriicola soli]
MNKLLILCGMVFLGITSTPQSSFPDEVQLETETNPVILLDENFVATSLVINVANWECTEETESKTLELSAIPYLEDNEELDLGFNTADYLPQNFDPYRAYFDLASVEYVNIIEEEVHDSDLSLNLPEDFNPFAFPAHFMDVSYIEEEDLSLGFDTEDYLLAGFDPYKKELDLNSIVYLEDEDLDLGFDTGQYLPENFNPYSL